MHIDIEYLATASLEVLTPMEGYANLSTPRAVEGATPRGNIILEAHESWMLSAAVLLGLLFFVLAWKLLRFAVPGMSIDFLAHLGVAAKVAIVAASVVLHEFVHIAAFLLVGSCSWKDIEMGVTWKSLTPFVRCNRPVRVGAFRWCVVAPLLVTALAPAAVGAIAKSSPLLCWSILMTSAAAGDVLIALRTIGLPRTALVLDSRDSVGFTAFLPEPPE